MRTSLFFRRFKSLIHILVFEKLNVFVYTVQSQNYTKTLIF